MQFQKIYIVYFRLVSTLVNFSKMSVHSFSNILIFRASRWCSGGLHCLLTARRCTARANQMGPSCWMFCLHWWSRMHPTSHLTETLYGYLFIIIMYCIFTYSSTIQFNQLDFVFAFFALQNQSPKTKPFFIFENKTNNT